MWGRREYEKTFIGRYMGRLRITEVFITQFVAACH
jgi:hypothetical protein